MCRAFGGLNPKRKEGKKGTVRGDQLAARKEAGVCLASIREFERGLVDDGYEVVKFFIHVSAEGQRERLERLAADPTTAWRVDKKRLERIGNYEYAYSIYDLMLEGSNFAFAPWTLVNGEDKRRANIVIAQTLVRALESAACSQGGRELSEGRKCRGLGECRGRLDPRRRLGFRGRRRETAPVLCRPRDFPLSPYR